MLLPSIAFFLRMSSSEEAEDHEIEIVLDHPCESKPLNSDWGRKVRLEERSWIEYSEDAQITVKK